jgi:hypothetical protein
LAGNDGVMGAEMGKRMARDALLLGRPAYAQFWLTGGDLCSETFDRCCPGWTRCWSGRRGQGGPWWSVAGSRCGRGPVGGWLGTGGGVFEGWVCGVGAW